MRKSVHFVAISLVLIFSLNVRSQDSASAKPPAPAPRNTEGAKAAETEGQQLLFQKHDLKAAIESFKKAVKLDPWYGHGYIMLGLAYIQSQKWDEAQWAFEDASKVEPENPQAWLGVGSALNEQKDYAGAQKALEHCLDLKPDSAEAHYEIGRSLWSLGKLEPAELHARRAIELNKDYASPHELMGNIYLDELDPEAALKEFRESLRLDPDGPQATEVKTTIAKLEKLVAEAGETKKR